MTKQNEIKEYDKEFEMLGIFIGIIIALLVILLILEFSIKQELSSVPHKVCKDVPEYNYNFTRCVFTSYDKKEIMVCNLLMRESCNEIRDFENCEVITWE